METVLYDFPLNEIRKDVNILVGNEIAFELLNNPALHRFTTREKDLILYLCDNLLTYIFLYIS